MRNTLRSLATRRRWARALLGVALVATVVPLWSQPASAATGPALTVDATAQNRPIDPRIYGINGYLLDPVLADQIDLPVERSGGDGASEYNWQLGSTSLAADWYFEIFGDTPGSTPGDQVVRNNAQGAASMLTLPIMGWVANAPGYLQNPAVNPCAFPRSVYPGQTKYDPVVGSANDPDCGSGWVCPAGTVAVDQDEAGHPLDGDANGTSFGFGLSRCKLPNKKTVAPNRIEGNDPTLADTCPGGRPNPTLEPYRCDAPAAFDAGWVQSMVGQHGTAASGGVELWSLDNEPDLWEDTHHQVHPQCVSYDELFSKARDVAAAVKAVDPSAQTLGPVTSDVLGSIDPPYDSPNEQPGTCSLHTDPSPDRQARGEFVAWYLDQMHQYEIDHGVRLLDVLDLHYYPQAAGVTLSPAGSAATQALRLRTTRSLWDPSYVDESWQSEVYPDLRIALIPRMQQWTADHYPGTKTAITEYNFGGLDQVNGALTQADVLGIFARQGLDIATFWPDNGGFTAAMPGANAFRIYRNYDGNGSKFGDTWVQSYSGDVNQSGQDKLAVYSAKRADGALTTVVINKTNGALTSPLSVRHFSSGPKAQVWRYSKADAQHIVRQADVPVDDGSLTTSFPAQSITLLVTPPRAPSDPTVTVGDVSLTEGASGTTNATFTVSLSQPVPSTVSVKYATANGTAIAPGDYRAKTATVLSFPAGTTTQTISIPVKGDKLPEGDETFSVELSSPVGVVIGDRTGTGTIVDDDGTPPTLSVAPVTVTEGSSGSTNAVFTFQLSHASGVAASVKYATANGTAIAPGDFTAKGATVLSFPAGTTSQTVSIPVKPDKYGEADETFSLVLTAPAGLTPNQSSVTATIVDDDPPAPQVTIDDVTVNEGDSGTTNAVFTVHLSGPAQGTVTLRYRTQDGTAVAPGDYTAKALTTLSFAAGQTSKTISVPVKGDTLDDNPETFLVVLSDPSDGLVLADATGTGTIVDPSDHP